MRRFLTAFFPILIVFGLFAQLAFVSPHAANGNVVSALALAPSPPSLLQQAAISRIPGAMHSA